MKTLSMTKDASGNRATVECATGEVSVYKSCAFCEHCKGIKVGPRLYPAPQEQVQKEMKRGSVSDDALMVAALQFNQLVRDGSAIECADDKNLGFRPRYRL
ncbi:MAG: hypothetical protein A4E37_01571 [Methanoregulaceae archaeon PtaB.Bin056]|jgi:hypothetical protein|nr:MAG: hypothetical protein A4E37_01571 [Methanoregulaceae archaeon PtaB.Bin056]